jgi:monoamine oxidase
MPIAAQNYAVWVFSDERYHVVEGNDKITQGLRDRLQAPTKLGMKLLRVRQTGTKQIELTFQMALAP